MSLRDVKSSDVIRSMENSFPKEVNDSAQWNCDIDNDTMTISGRVNGEKHSCRTNTKQEVNDRTKKRMTPYSGIADAVVFFQKLIKDSVKEEVTVIEEKFAKEDAEADRDEPIELPPETFEKSKVGGNKRK